MNSTTLLGRITNDLEIKEVGEVKVLNFSLAVARQKKDETDFIPVVAFGKTAEALVNFTEKGKRVLVDGAIRITNYQDKDGNKKTTTKVVANHIQIIDFKNKDVNPAMQGQDDDLPF